MELDKILKEHSFNCTPSNNGGESLRIITQFISNGDDITDGEGVYLNQQITLQSYSNSASIDLFGSPLTPELLRTLANQLERERIALCKLK